MRFMVYGAGAIGGVIGGRLFEAGHDVTLVARGDHLVALQARGLELVSPAGRSTLAVPAVGHPSEAELADGDVVVLAMKSQDTADALAALVAHAPPGINVVCAQNGVENERLALRTFENVYAMTVMCPATHLEAGTVVAQSAPKYRKLSMNLVNAAYAVCAESPELAELLRILRAEGEAAFAAAGIDLVSVAEDQARRGDSLQMRPIEGQRRGGGSTWQSLARGTGSIETDYLSGEAVLLGRLHGVPTPANALLQRLAHQAAAAHLPPGHLAAADVLAQLG
jgi:2-dehydropantoate 2-reductase